MFKYIALIFTFLCVSYTLNAQCSCTDCPIFTISNNTVQSVLNISGATNSTLGANNQYLSEICIEYFTDAVDEVDMVLYAPDGSSVLLMAQTGISVNDGMTFNICFEACDCFAMPDDGFSPVFDSAEPWQTNNVYTGLYYPAEDNCLEDLTGNVNGDWILEVTDFIGGDDGTIFNWSLHFNDNSGAGCSPSNCAPFDCEAVAGELSYPSATICEGSADLDLDFMPSYPQNNQPDPIDYSYVFVVTDNVTGIVLDYLATPNLMGYPGGEYLVCGMSYYTGTENFLPDPNGVLTLDELNGIIINPPQCADITDDCVFVEIVPFIGSAIVGPTSVCAGTTVVYTILNYDPTAFYSIVITSGIGNIIDIDDDEISVEWSSGPGQICNLNSLSCDPEPFCITLDIVEEPITDLEIIGPEIVCPFENVVYEVLPLIQNYMSYSYTVTNGDIVSENGNLVEVMWEEDGQSGEICVQIEDAFCSIDEVCIEVVANDVDPIQSLNSPDSFCAGDIVSSFAVDDIDIVEYNWTFFNLTEVINNGTFEVSYTSLSPGPATLCLEIVTYCGPQPLICESIMVFYQPTISLFATNPICDFEFELFSAVDVYDELQWTFVNGPGNAIIQNPFSSNTGVVVDESGTYTFNLLASSNGCMSEETIEVNVSESLEAQLITIDCLPNSNYTVLFEIQGGEAPFEANDEFFAGTTYVSDEINSGSSYTITFSDVNGCETLVQGVFSCDCETMTGAMSSETLRACALEGETIQGEYLGGEINDGDDIGLFYLHDGSGSSLGTIIASNNTGLFEYEQTIIPGELYYISFVFGTNVNGEPDLTDFCTQVSFGQPVIFTALPEAVLDNIQSCLFDFEIQFTSIENALIIDWMQISGPISGDITNVGLISNFTTEESGVFEFEYALLNNECVILDTVQIEIYPSMDIVNIESICTDDLLEYVLYFTIEGGTADFTASIPGIFTNGEFISENLDVNSTYSIEIFDANNCAVSFDFGPVLCDCNNDIGTVNVDPISLCSDEILDPNAISNGDFILDDQDTIVFLFFENDDDPLDQYILSNFGEGISFGPPFVIGESYYIRLINGNYSSIDPSGVDFIDGCLLASEPIEIIWNETKEFTFNIDTAACISDFEISLILDFTGPFPYTITFDDGWFEQFEITITESPQLITFPIVFGPTNWTVMDYEGDCGYLVNGSIDVFGQGNQFVEFVESDTICNNEVWGSEWVLDELLVFPNVMGDWYLNGDLITEDIINFDGFPAGDYILRFSTIGFEDPCPGQDFEYAFYVKDCNCPSVSIESSLAVCNIDAEFDLSILVDSEFPGEYSIENPNNLDNLPIIIGGTMLDVSNASAGEYLIVFTLSDDFPDECDMEFYTNLEIEQQLSAGNATEIPLYCDDDESQIDFQNYMEGFDTGGSWYFQNGEITMPYDLLSLDTGLYSYEYIIPATDNCPEISSNFELYISPNPAFDYLSENVLCFGQNDGIISVQLSSEEHGPYLYELNGEEFGTNVFQNLSPGYYEVAVFNVEGCKTIVDSILIEEPEPLTVSLGEDRLVDVSDTITIQAIINILQSDVDSIQWSDLNGYLDADQLALIKNFISNNSIAIVITDENGCVSEDQINIRIRDRDLYIPNVFNPNSAEIANRRFSIFNFREATQIDEFQIFDRWGNLVFSRENILSDDPDLGWDGQFNGQDAQAGVYVYYCVYESELGEKLLISGDVTLVR